MTRTRRQPTKRLGVRAARSDQHAGDGRSHERPRYRPLAELGKHDRQLEDAEDLPTNRFGECNLAGL